MAGAPTAGNLLPAFLCLAALVANHSIFRLGALPSLWAAVVVVVVAATALAVPHLGLLQGNVGYPNRANLSIGAVAVAPVLASLALGLNREFPFSGDQSFHIKQAYYMAFWWLSPVASQPLPILGRALSPAAVRDLLVHPSALVFSRAALLVLVVGAVAGCYRWSRLSALALGVVALVAWGSFEHAIYLRYPGAGYFLASPFVGPAFFLGNIELARRIPNVLAAPLWLFLLRPLFIGRWPDWKILPVAALLLWHRDVIYYFDSTYLEPWAVVCALVAVESVIDRGPRGAPAACLFVGLAATVKEPFIFALPLVWLAGQPWRARPRDVATLSGAALAAGFPFVLYYVARTSVSAADIASARGVAFDVSVRQFAGSLDGLGRQMAYAYGGTAAVPALAALAALPLLLLRPRPVRFPLLCTAAAGVAIVLFFMLDENSSYWAGTFRFFLCACPFLAAGTMAFGYRVKPRVAAAAGLAVLLLQAPSAFAAIARSTGPASDRNFAEHYDAPLVFPLKSILAEARRDYGLPRGATVWANQPDAAVKPVPGIDVEFGPLGQLLCTCQGEHPYVLALFVRYANLSAPFDHAPPSPDELFAPPLAEDRIWRQNKADQPMCIAELRRGCARVVERTEGGEVTAVLGIR